MVLWNPEKSVTAVERPGAKTTLVAVQTASSPKALSAIRATKTVAPRSANLPAQTKYVAPVQVLATPKRLALARTRPVLQISTSKTEILVAMA